MAKRREVFWDLLPAFVGLWQLILGLRNLLILKSYLFYHKALGKNLVDVVVVSTPIKFDVLDRIKKY